jgi:hypothetical protein
LWPRPATNEFCAEDVWTMFRDMLQEMDLHWDLDKKDFPSLTPIFVHTPLRGADGNMALVKAYDH